MVPIGDTLELFNYEREPSIKRFTSPKKTDENLRSYIKYLRSIQDEPQTRSTRSISRSRYNFSRIISATLSMGRPTLISATIYRSVQIKTAYKYLTQFQQRLRYHYGKNIISISVPEFQKRDAIHFHCLIWGLPPDAIYHEAPYQTYYGHTHKQRKRRDRFIQFCHQHGFQPTEARGQRSIQLLWRRGYLDCTPTDGSKAIASYLSKYMRKAEDDIRLSGQKSYTTTRNVQRPKRYTSINSLKWDQDFKGILIDDFIHSRGLTLSYEKTYSTQWLGEATFKRYITIESYVKSKSDDLSSRREPIHRQKNGPTENVADIDV